MEPLIAHPTANSTRSQFGFASPTDDILEAYFFHKSRNSHASFSQFMMKSRNLDSSHGVTGA